MGVKEDGIVAALAAFEGAAGAEEAGALSEDDFCAQAGLRPVETKAASVTTVAIATEKMLRRAAQRWWLSIRRTHCHKQLYYRLEHSAQTAAETIFTKQT